MTDSSTSFLAGPVSSRRDALRLALQVSTLAVLAVPLGTLAGCAPPAAEAYATRNDLLAALTELVLPAQGAGANDNKNFLFRAMDRGMKGVTFSHLDALGQQLDDAAGGNFLSATTAQRGSALVKVDQDTFAADKPVEHPWYGIKAMILMAYFTSQPGMEDTLRYELVPGRYDSDLPVNADFKPLSNDWSAVSIRKPLVSS